MASYGTSNSKDDKPKKAVVRMSAKVKQQLIILAICRAAEPMALSSVYPYLYFMVKSFGLPESNIGFWVGIMSASFSVAQFLSAIWWGRMSDRYGRKYTILAGLCGTFISLIMFGFAKSMRMAITARFMAGLLNGNVGIMRTLVAEIVPEKELQPVAFSLLPLIWTVGSIFSPVIGGYLSDPVTNYPGYFSPGGFLSKYPYALPNLFIAFLVSIGIITCFLFLEETLESQKHEHDIGCELGQKLLFIFRKNNYRHQKSLAGDENSSLLTPSDEEEARVNTAKIAPTTHKQDIPPFKEAITTLTVFNIVIYTFLALHAVSFDQLIPINMAYPRIITRDSYNPLRFFGGFGMTSPQMGSIFSLCGILAMLNQFFVFPPIAAKYGTLVCFRWCAFIFPIIYLVVPFTVFVSGKSQGPAIFIIIFIKQMVGVFAYPCSTILVTNSSPSLRVLGTLNGIATATSAVGRAIGPTLSGAAFTYGQKVNYLILPWWILAGLAILGALPVLWLVEGNEWPKKDEDKVAVKHSAGDISRSHETTDEGDSMRRVSTNLN